MTIFLYVRPSRESINSVSGLNGRWLLLDSRISLDDDKSSAGFVISLDDDSVIWLLLELAELLGLSCELQDCVLVELERLDEEFSILSM